MKLTRRMFVSALALAAAPSVLFAQDLSDLFPQEDTVDPVKAAEIAPVVTTVSLQPQGRFMATAGDDHLVRIWEMESGKLRHRLDGHTDWVRCVCFHPDGNTLATGSNDRRVLIWNPDTGKQIRTLVENQRAIAKLAFAPDGGTLATLGFNDRLRLYDAATGDTKGEWACPCPDMRELAFSPDGAMIAAAGRSGVIRIYNSRTGEVLRDIAAHRRRIRGLEFTSDNRAIVSVAEDGVLKASNIVGDQVTAIPAQPCKFLSLKLVGDNLAAIGGSDNSIRLWDIRKKNEDRILRGHIGSVSALDFRDGVLVSGSYDTTVRSWPVEETVNTALISP